VRERPAWVDEIDEMVEGCRRALGDLPYDPTPAGLYNCSQLYAGLADGFYETVDQQIYRRAQISGGPPVAPVEALVQRTHDHGITMALNQFRHNKELVGVMGGHTMARGSEGYSQVVELGRDIAKSGRVVVTGGGPGAMEAANFGAATSELLESQVESMISELAEVPTFADDPTRFIEIAVNQAEDLEDPVENLSVPTWFYGHEPSNPYATDIAKYFSNSAREDGLLAIATAGIVFVQGGPGTIQEVFQDAAQNAYRTYGDSSPMIFLEPPSDPPFWAESGVMDVLDRTFLNHHGERRPGWDLLQRVSDVPQAMTALAGKP
jgi:predicted Rossmann-fold nucleotide-binding protein